MSRRNEGNSGNISVTFLGSWPPIPGISTYCVHAVRALAETTSVRVLTFSKMYPDFLYPKGPVPEDHSFPTDGLEHVPVDRILAWYNPLGWIRAGRAIESDLLHVQFWSLPVAPVLAVVMFFARRRGKRIVLTVHNPVAHDRGFLFALATRLLIRLSHAVICHIPKTPDWFSSACASATGHAPYFVPHGVLNLYHETTTHRASAPLLPPDAEGVLFFGAIRPYKGLDQLLVAFDEVANRRPNAHLIIAGRPWESWEPYRELYAGKPWENRVLTQLDYIPTRDVARYFEAATLVVLPYLEFDTQSGVALSAAGFGKPMIVTAVGALPDLQSDPHFVVPPKDPAALTRAILQALENPDQLQKLTESSQAVARGHDWRDIARQTTQIYQTLLSRSPDSP